MTEIAGIVNVWLNVLGNILGIGLLIMAVRIFGCRLEVNARLAELQADTAEIKLLIIEHERQARLRRGESEADGPAARS